MYLKNEAARLITINADGKKYQVLPGLNPVVEVPDEVAKIPFVKALLKNGSLRRISKVDVDGDDSASYDAMDREMELIDQAEKLGIAVDKRWGEKRLLEEIAKAAE